MKVTVLSGIAVLFFCISGLTGCDGNNEDGRTVTDYKEYVLTVASEKVPGVLWAEGSDFLSEVYAVKKEQSDEWSAFGIIDGFEFEKGYECRIRIAETSYLDYSMGQPAWDERELLEVISKDKKDSENLPVHFIPAAYYGNVPLLQYRYAVDADDKELIENDLEANSLFPLDYHYMFYRDGENSLMSIAMHDDGNVWGPYVVKTGGKDPAEMPDSYKLLPPDARVVGYGEWTFSDEAGNAVGNLSFDVFTGYATKTKSVGLSPYIVFLYKDLTGHYRTEYPEAGVKTVVVSYGFRLSL